MPEPQDVASRYDKRRRLWKAAIKWPMYSVAVMPVLLAAGWRLGAGLALRWDQLFGFLLAAILLLLWENLSNDLFDADTGIDERGKPHSVINLTGRRDWVALLLRMVGLPAPLPSSSAVAPITPGRPASSAGSSRHVAAAA